MKKLQPHKKRRTLTWVIGLLLGLSVVFALGIFTAQSERASAFNGQGTGSASDPFQISTCAQLQEMQLQRNAHYVLISRYRLHGVA